MFKEKGIDKKDKLMILIMSIVLYFVIYGIAKLDIISHYMGIVCLILIYMYSKYNLINIFFSSKRTTFKIYIFMMISVVFLVRYAFSTINLIIYLILLIILWHLLVNDEGKVQIPKINKFMRFYILWEIIFILTFIFY